MREKAAPVIGAAFLCTVFTSGHRSAVPNGRGRLPGVTSPMDSTPGYNLNAPTALFPACIRLL